MCRYLLLSLLMLLFIFGCDSEKSGPTDAELDRIALTQKIELVKAEGGLALVVGGETITSGEIIGSRAEFNRQMIVPRDYLGPLAQANDIEKFKSLAKPALEEIVTKRITRVLLVQHAKRQAGTNVDEALEKAAESELRKYVLGFGGNEAKADEELEKLGLDRESFKESQKKSLLINWYLGSELADARPVTYREMVDCYNEMKDEYFARVAKITFRLIDIQPDKLDVSEAPLDRDQMAVGLANELITRLKIGEDFTELAKQYSHGHRKAFGGLWPSVQPDSLAAPYNILAAEAQKIEPGAVAGPIVVEGRVFVMKLEEKQAAGYEPFENADVQDLVERKVLLDRRSTVQGRLEAKLREEARLGRADEFVDFCLEKIHTMSRQPQSEAEARPANK
jgi:parvulin-like peptidyl-prolyl isomerase